MNCGFDFKQQKSKVHSEAENTFTIKVNELPVKAGIDPINKLIDRNPDDNIKTLTEETESD